MHSVRMEIIRKKRRELGMSQATLADNSGLAQSFISRLERGETDVSMSNMMALLVALGLRPQDVIPPDSPQGRLIAAMDRIPPAKHETVADILERLADSFALEPPKAE